MERYSFFNAVMDSNGNYDREYLAEDFAAYFASFIGNGVYASPSSNLKVLSTGSMSVEVSAGKAWINGYFYENTEKKAFSLDILNQTAEYSRIDSIVLRLDLLNRKITTELKKGTASKNPTAPTLIHNDNVHELRLANVKVVGGRTEIKSQDITDCRFGSECGVVSGVVKQIDTEGLFSQYDDEFYNFMDEVKDAFSRTEVGSLQNQIDVERKRIDAIASLEEGSTTADAELVDIRIGADGVSYDSAGNAVRNQFAGVHERLDLLNDAIPKNYELDSITLADIKLMDTYFELYNADGYLDEDKHFSNVMRLGGQEGTCVYVGNVKKGDCFLLSNAFNLHVKYPYIVAFDTDGYLKQVESFQYIKDQRYYDGKYTINQDGTLYVCFDYTEASQETEFFYIKRTSRTEPFVLNANVNYESDSETGEATLKAIMEGKNVVVRVPNVSGDNYVATYSPIYMYQLPNYKNDFLYLFYLKDEKQEFDLTALGIGKVEFPIYGQIKMKLSKEYNQTPLK